MITNLCFRGRTTSLKPSRIHIQHPKYKQSLCGRVNYSRFSQITIVVEPPRVSYMGGHCWKCVDNLRASKHAWLRALHGINFSA